jgi:hypothetical protein
MNTALAAANTNNPLRAALERAGRHLAARNIHGRFRLARGPRDVAVTFLGATGSSPRIDVEALVEAVLCARDAGLAADRFGLQVQIAA